MRHDFKDESTVTPLGQRVVPGLPAPRAKSARLAVPPRLFARSSLVAALLLAGSALHADPLFFSQTDNFVLSTTDRDMYGSGPTSNWSYDSGFLGTKWGRYTAPNASPIRETVGGIVGSSSTVILPKLCVWSPWGDACTPEVTVDTRTGAELTLESSGKIGATVTASAQGGKISANVPIQAQVQITKNTSGVLHVGGSSTLNTAANAGALITTQAPSFKAGIDAQLALNMGIGFDGCITFAGCTSSAGRSLGFNMGSDVLAIDTTKTKPLSALGLDLPIPGINKYYEIRKDADASKGYSETALDGKAVAKVGGPILAQVKVDLPKDGAGGSVSNGQLSFSERSAALHFDADLTGIAQYMLGVPVDVLNPKVSATVGGFGLSVGGTLVDVLAGIYLGMDQTFTIKPKLQVELQFDKPIGEYVQELDYNESRQVGTDKFYVFGGYDFGIGGAGVSVYGTEAKRLNDEYNIALAAYRLEHPSGSDDGSHMPYGPNPTDGNAAERLIINNTAYDSEQLGSRGRPIRWLNPGAELDASYGGYQCRPIIDFINYPESNGQTGRSECIAGTLESAHAVYADFPVYKAGKFLADRGNTVTVNLDRGADLQFIGEQGKVVGWKYSMSDETNFRSQTSLALSDELLIKAACLKASITGVASFDECLFRWNTEDAFANAIGRENFTLFSVFDNSFNLDGFNTVAFRDTSGDWTDPEPPRPPDENGGGTVSEPGALPLMLLALAGLWVSASRRGHRRAIA